MRFSAKLERLIAQSGKPRAQIAKAAGLKPTILNNYINRGSEPMARSAMLLAKSLGVSADWLLDDNFDWPPPTRDGGFAEISDEELMRELAHRYRNAMLAVRRTLDELKGVDWAEVAENMYTVPLGAPLPPDVESAAAKIMNSMGAEARAAFRFDVRAEAGNVPPAGGGPLPAMELHITKVEEELSKVVGANNFLRLATAYLHMAGLFKVFGPASASPGIIGPAMATTAKNLESQRREGLAEIRKMRNRACVGT